MSLKSKSLKRFREMGGPELAKEERELRSAIWKLKLQGYTGQTADPKKLEATKRDLARVLTLQRQREVDRARPGARQEA